jgi:hypothetical protein
MYLSLASFRTNRRQVVDSATLPREGLRGGARGGGGEGRGDSRASAVPHDGHERQIIVSLSRFPPQRVHALNACPCVHVSACVHAAGRGRGRAGRDWGEKREAVILPGRVPEALVKLPRGLIIINREGRHDLRYKLSAALERRYGYFRVYFSPRIRTPAETAGRLSSRRY